MITSGYLWDLEVLLTVYAELWFVYERNKLQIDFFPTQSMFLSYESDEVLNINRFTLLYCFQAILFLNSVFRQIM